jgi:hypothetical protein
MMEAGGWLITDLSTSQVEDGAVTSELERGTDLNV